MHERFGMAPIRQPDILRHTVPVADLVPGKRLGVRLAQSVGQGLAVEIIELRRQLADDA